MPILGLPTLKTSFSTLGNQVPNWLKRSGSINKLESAGEHASIFTSVDTLDLKETVETKRNDIAFALSKIPTGVQKLLTGVTFNAKGEPMRLTPEGKNIITRAEKRAIKKIITPEQLEAYAQLRGIGVLEAAAANITHSATTFFNRLTGFARKVMNTITAPFRFIYNKLRGLFGRQTETTAPASPTASASNTASAAA